MNTTHGFNWRVENPPTFQETVSRYARIANATRVVLQEDWYINPVLSLFFKTFRNRMERATNYLQAKVVKNISRPVTKEYFVRDGVTDPGFDQNQHKTARKTSVAFISNRSKKGEFPKEDTSRLVKSIKAYYVNDSSGKIMGAVGSEVDYAIKLETTMQRSFLIRTLYEEMGTLRRILGSPIKFNSSTPMKAETTISTV